MNDIVLFVLRPREDFFRAGTLMLSSMWNFSLILSRIPFSQAINEEQTFVFLRRSNNHVAMKLRKWNIIPAGLHGGNLSHSGNKCTWVLANKSRRADPTQQMKSKGALTGFLFALPSLRLTWDVKLRERRACICRRQALSYLRVLARTRLTRGLKKIQKWVYNSSLEAQLTAWKAVKINLYMYICIFIQSVLTLFPTFRQLTARR